MEKNLVFGGKCTALSMSYDHVSQCWRTCQQSLFGEASKSLDRLPKSGMMQSGLLYQRNSSEHHTKENVGFVLPTPAASDVKRKMASPCNLRAKDRGYGLCLSAQVLVDQQPTPQAQAIGDRLTLNPSFVEWMMGFPEDWTVPD